MVLAGAGHHEVSVGDPGPPGVVVERFGGDEGELPRNWKIQVRDVLKHDPEIEKMDDGTWVLRTQDEA